MQLAIKLTHITYPTLPTRPVLTSKGQTPPSVVGGVGGEVHPDLLSSRMSATSQPMRRHCTATSRGGSLIRTQCARQRRAPPSGRGQGPRLTRPRPRIRRGATSLIRTNLSPPMPTPQNRMTQADPWQSPGVDDSPPSPSPSTGPSSSTPGGLAAHKPIFPFRNVQPPDALLTRVDLERDWFLPVTIECPVSFFPPIAIRHQRTRP